MSSRANKRRDVLDVLGKLKKYQRMINGQNRQNYSGLASADFGSVSSNASSGGGTSTSSGSSSSFLKTKGDTMIGPFAFKPVLVSITSNAIDISNTTTSYSSYVILAAPLGTLNTITGVDFDGQVLFLQGVTTITHTIGTTGNIQTIDGSNYSLVGDDVIILVFDITLNKWKQITRGKETTAGGGWISTATSSLNMSTYDINGIDRLIFSSAASSDDLLSASDYGIEINGGTTPTGLKYNVPSSKKHEFYVNNVSQISISSSALGIESTNTNISSNQIVLGADATSQIFYFGRMTSSMLPLTSVAYNLGSPILLWDTLYVDDVLIGGATKGMSNIGTLSFVNNTVTPAGNGIIYFDGTDLKAKTGSTTVNLTNISGSNFTDAVFEIHDELDSLKKFKVDVTGATSSTTATLDFNQTANRTYTFPNVTTTLVGLDVTQTFTGINTFNENIVAGGAGDGMSNIGNLQFVSNLATPVNTLSIYSDGTNLISGGADWDFNIASLTKVDALQIVDTGGVARGTLFGDSGEIVLSFTSGQKFSINNSITQVAEFDSSGLEMFNDIRLAASTRIKANSSTEIGYYVTNASTTIGAEGTVQIPTKNVGVSNAAAANTDFGTEIGCIGLYRLGTPILVIKYSSTGWQGIILGSSGNPTLFQF